jgi:CHAT domain-containing protein
MAIGAAGVLSTLWQVDDRATALLIARFYDLHLGDGLAPQSALQQAQQWLRTTTRKQFIAYASAAVIDGRIADAGMGLKLEASLMRSTYGHTRFASIWAWLNTKIKAGVPEETAQAHPDEKPFAHPYFWGGFIHLGL